MFKMSKKWKEAGEAFCAAAELHGKAGSRHDAATNFVDASNCYKKSDPNESVSCLMKAIEIYTGKKEIFHSHHVLIFLFTK